MLFVFYTDNDVKMVCVLFAARRPAVYPVSQWVRERLDEVQTGVSRWLPTGLRKIIHKKKHIHTKE